MQITFTLQKQFKLDFFLLDMEQLNSKNGILKTN